LPKVARTKGTAKSGNDDEAASIIRRICIGRHGLIYITEHGGFLSEEVWPKGLVLKFLDQFDQEGRAREYDDIRNRAISHGILDPTEGK
jgi:hypothetical protein